MATYDSLFVVEDGEATNLSVNAGAASAAQAFKGKFIIIADGDFKIKFGGAGVAATANSMRMPGDAVSRFDMGESTHFSIFNPGASAINVQYKRISSN